MNPFVDRHRYFAAVAWVAVIAAILSVVGNAGMDMLANAVVLGTSGVGCVLAFLSESRRRAAAAKEGSNVKQTDAPRPSHHCLRGTTDV